MRGNGGRSRRGLVLGVGVLAILTALAFVVLPAIGAVGGSIPPASTGGVTPIEFDTGGQSNDCALFSGNNASLSQYRISTPKSQTYTTQVNGRTVTFKLTVSTGQTKDKFVSFTSTGARIFYVGIKGGTNTAEYDYTSAPVTADGNLHAPKDNQGNLYSVSNTTFCFTTGASVAGTVFVDANASGSRDSGDAGYQGATVRLYSGSSVVATATSDVNGLYTFPNVAFGSYTVCQVPLGTGWQQTYPGASTTGSAPCTTEGNRGYGVSVASSVQGLDFGNLQTASVSGRVFEDLNANGQADTGEGGLTAQAVTLRRAGSPDRTATLAADGTFTIADVPVAAGYTLCVAGSTSLRETVPTSATPGTTDCSAEGTRGYSFSLASGGSTGNLFGLVRQATISGTIFDDKNANGQLDPGEGGLAGRTVHLYKGDSTTPTNLQTAADGSFSFGQQDVGTQYRVCVDVVAGETQTYPTSTTTGSVACTGTGETPYGWGISLTTAGEANLGFASVKTVAGSCLDPFGDDERYKIQLAGGPPDPCDKTFVYSYQDTDGADGGFASLIPVVISPSPTTYAMIERITWKLPSDGTQFNIQYDDTPPYEPTGTSPMKYCKLDPRDGTDFGVQPAYYSADFGGNPSLVLPGSDTSCLISENASTQTGEYVAFVYSSIDGLRLPNN